MATSASTAITARDLPGEAELEALTQRIGRELLGQLGRQPEQPLEFLQDRFLSAIAQDATLRTSLLRFVDVLAALDFDRDGHLTARLAREYLDRPVQQLPQPFRTLPALALRAPVPPSLVRLAALRATMLVADRFIVEPAGAGAASGAIPALGRLRRSGLYPSFDILGEHVVGEQEAAAYLRRYLDLITALGRQAGAGDRTPGGVRALQVSVKLSALTPRYDPVDPAGTLERVRRPFSTLVDAAAAAGVAVTVDMEEYRLRELTWTIFQTLFGPGSRFAGWPDAGIVLQAYLADAPRQVADYIAFARNRGVPFQVRLVKGAYWDYESIVATAEGWPPPVLQVKAETDRQFEQIVSVLVGAHPALLLAVGSHNLRSHARAEAVRQALGLPAQAIEHQTLYGMAPHISRALRDMGWPVREYMPGGPLLAGMSYLVRRILENSSQTGFLLQSRRGARSGDLLAIPRVTATSSEEPAGMVAVDGDGFANTPPLRLFLKEEREQFAAALQRAAGRPADRFALDLPLGPDRQWLRPLNPSQPDPQRPAVEVEAATAEDVTPALHRLVAAAPAWRERTARERGAILRRTADLLLERRAALAAAMVLEGGKNWSNALGDVDEAVDYLRFYPWVLEQIGSSFVTLYQPRGVVAVIPPWNFPLAIPCGMTAAALVTGNTVALKPAEQTPGITARLVALLHEAGVPRDALIHLPGDGEAVGGALVRSPLVDMIAFTGSREVGLWIAETAAATPGQQSLKQVVAEMGGKNAIAVFPDADLDEAVEGILTSTFGHANQKCSACSRVFAHQAIYGRLRRRLAEGARSLPAGPATAAATVINPLIDAVAVQRVRAMAETARREGKVVLDLLEQPSRACPICLGPLIVELAPGALLDARTAQEEIFGPVLALAPFTSEAEALAQINGTAYGLTAGIFSRSPATIRRMTAGIHAGNIYVNREITGARVGVEPFGGMGLSGTGPKAGGEAYLYAFVRQRGDWRTSPISPASTMPVGGVRWPGIKPWNDPIQRRESRLRLAVRALETGKEFAAPSGLIAAFAAMLRQTDEITEQRPTIALPGQETVLDWSLPRGVGLVVVDESAPPSSLGFLTAAALLAGNGVVLAVPHVLGRAALALVLALRRAGVPPTSLVLLPTGQLPDTVPDGRFNFIAADVSLTRAGLLAASLARQHAGQRAIPAFMSVTDAPAPGEPEFLRRFTIPRTIAIRTLRHGADLGA